MRNASRHQSKVTMSGNEKKSERTRTATESVRRLSDQFSQAQDHILLKNRLKIKEVTNSASENLNRKNTT